MERRALIFRIKYLVYLLGILLILGLFMIIPHRNSDKDLLFQLEKGEALIDSITDEALAYTLVSRQGQKDYGDLFVVFENTSDEWVRIYENDFKNLMPWKIDLSDVDGDNVKEILIAVKKATLFDKEVKNRMFVFNFNQGILTRKWTGSQISGVWRDFFSADILPIQGNELIFIETDKEDKERINIYSWFDFGFIKIAESEPYPRIEDLKIAGDNLLEITFKKDGQIVSHTLTATDGKLMAISEEGK